MPPVAGPVAEPQQAIAASVPRDAAARPGLVINPVHSLRAHKWIAVGLFVLLGALGLPVAWWRGTPVYSTEAVVFISPRFLKNLQEDKEFELQSNSQYREYVQQNVRTINRYDIVAAALDRLGPRRSLWQARGETDRHAAERLQGALDIRPVPDTYQVVVGLEGRQREGLAEIVNSVVETYLERAKSEEFYASDKRLVSLRQDGARLQQEINVKQRRRTELSQELGVSTFTENFPNPYDRLLVGSKEALADATRKRVEADAALASVEGDSGSGAASTLAAFAREQAAKDAALTSIQANLNQRRAELLARMNGLSSEHPGRRAAEREIADIDRELVNVSERLVASYSSILLEQRRGEARKNRRVEADLRAEVGRQAEQAAWFTDKYQEAMTLKLDIERSRKRLDAIEDRVNFLSLETQAPGFVRMFSRARAPEVPSKGGRTRVLGLFLVAALGLAIGVPVAIDVLDRRVYTARGLHRVLGFEPLAWFIERSACPDFAEEQVLRLANRIDQDRSKTGSRIFAFTGALPGSGTTTIVLETARALRALGVPALAVEANAYCSDHSYKERSGGLRVMLTGNHDLKDAIATGEPGMPDHIASGALNGARNLPDIHRLIEVLRAGAEVYDLVLIDLPPVVLSVDAEYVGRVADVVVLVVPAGRATAADVKRAAGALERLEPRAVAAVINRVQPEGLDKSPRAAITEFIAGGKEGG